ncbi:MAG TPA: hypothetical protein ENN13_01850 [Candidatus Altiarchaeales archaeon]|nr:hypothetical protein [Candidatus Altiarchaeales archaeon]
MAVVQRREQKKPLETPPDEVYEVFADEKDKQKSRIIPAEIRANALEARRKNDFHGVFNAIDNRVFEQFGDSREALGLAGMKLTAITELVNSGKLNPQERFSMTEEYVKLAKVLEKSDDTAVKGFGHHAASFYHLNRWKLHDKVDRIYDNNMAYREAEKARKLFEEAGAKGSAMWASAMNSIALTYKHGTSLTERGMADNLQKADRIYDEIKRQSSQSKTPVHSNILAN